MSNLPKDLTISEILDEKYLQELIKQNISLEVNKICAALVSLYRDYLDAKLNEEMEAKMYESEAIIQKFLLKVGKLCASCKNLINQHKDISDIQTCDVCHHAFCERCLERKYYKCVDCGTVFCLNDFLGGDAVILEGEALTKLCHICVEEGKYQKEDTRFTYGVCQECLYEHFPCESYNEFPKCEHHICAEHSKTFKGKAYSPDCIRDMKAELVKIAEN